MIHPCKNQVEVIELHYNIQYFVTIQWEAAVYTALQFIMAIKL